MYGQSGPTQHLKYLENILIEVRMLIGIDARILTLSESRGMASYLLELLKRWPDPQDELILFSEDQPKPERVLSPAQIKWKQVISPRGSRFHIWDWWSLPKAVRQT